jgi:hypothetical protein
MISKLNSLPGRALDLVSQVGDGLRSVVPAHAGKILDAGAKLGALKGGARTAAFFVRRHPVAVAGTVAGAGLLWYLARRRAKQAEHAPIEGRATRVEAKRASASKSTAGARSRSRTTRTRESRATH